MVIGLAVARLRSSPAESSEESARRGRLVGIASGVEGVLIFLAANILYNTAKGDLFVPVLALIVGLHFIPLAHWLPAPLYYATALLLVALAISGFVLADLHLRILMVSAGAALTLWLTSALVLIPRSARNVTVHTHNGISDLSRTRKSAG